jgi:hypothetical protein
MDFIIRKHVKTTREFAYANEGTGVRMIGGEGGNRTLDPGVMNAVL